MQAHLVACLCGSLFQSGPRASLLEGKFFTKFANS